MGVAREKSEKCEVAVDFETIAEEAWEFLKVTLLDQLATLG
jgi:hypothetical protein